MIQLQFVFQQRTEFGLSVALLGQEASGQRVQLVRHNRAAYLLLKRNGLSLEGLKPGLVIRIPEEAAA
jgi:hypothetical protein